MVRFFNIGAHDEFFGEIQEDLAMGTGHSRVRCHGLGVRIDVMVPPAVSIMQPQRRAQVVTLYPVSFFTHHEPASCRYSV